MKRSPLAADPENFLQTAVWGAVGRAWAERQGALLQTRALGGPSSGL